MTLDAFRITGKISVLATALCAIILGMAGIGAWKAANTSTMVQRGAAANEGVALAMQMQHAALTMGLAPTQLANGFSMTRLTEMRRQVVAAKEAFTRDAAAIEAHGGERRLQALAEVRRQHAEVATRLEAILALTAAIQRTEDWTEARRGQLLAALQAQDAALVPLKAALGRLSTVADEIADAAEESALSDARQLILTMSILAALGLGLGVLLTWLIGLRALAQPLGRSIARLRSLAAGDTAAPIPGQERRDEIGDIGRAMVVFRDNLIASRAAQAAQIAEAEAKAKRAQHLAALASRFEVETAGVVKTVASAATEMEATATGMAAGASSTAREAATVKQSASEASGNVQMVAAAAEQLAASVAEIARQMAESSRMAAEAVAEAGRTGETVQALSQKAQRIGQVVQLINAISGQTNLLALNATIEAARAGEAGKGFAVVASEVKSLASETGRATEDIAAQVQAVQAETARVVQAIEAMGSVIGRLNEIATGIAAAVEQQGAATTEIARNVQQAAASTASVSSTILAVDEAAQSSGAAAAQVKAAAQELSRGAETLRGQVDRFLHEMKAA